MDKVLLIALLVFNVVFSQSQNSLDKLANEKGFAFFTQGLFLQHYDHLSQEENTPYELDAYSRTVGANIMAQYYFAPYFSAGIGMGYEKLFQPEISYYPVFLELRGSPEDTKNAIYTKLNFGFHLGNLDNKGFLFRWGVGYRFEVSKYFLGYIEALYSHQNFDKQFENKTYTYYNFKSLGIALGIEIQ